ncbi:MAG: hypothetical protein H6712_07585 [Myxococcales bacterium]|nr:hypothetical protein [Myxococcales bacterium]MCB9713697.1 hypothetical protein [Myxococcales bacterium]
MMRSLVPPLARRVVGGLLPLLACRPTPSEAPEPDAGAWNEPTFGPSPAAPAVPDEPEPVALRPREPGTIFRDEIERATAPGPAYLLRQLGPEPYRHEGHFVGWRITRLFPDDPSLCAVACDLALDDVILSVNGQTMHTPQGLSDALQALPQWDSLEVHSLRGGLRRVVTYPIVDAPEG